MGLRVSVAEAAALTRRNQRTILRWIASGKLAAEPMGLREPREGVGPSRWTIEVERLRQLVGGDLDAHLLAELERQAAARETTGPLTERVARLEREVADLRARLATLEAARPAPSADGKES